MRFAELEFSVEYSFVRAPPSVRGRLQRPLPCRVRSAHRRERGWMPSETSSERLQKIPHVVEDFGYFGLSSCLQRLDDLQNWHHFQTVVTGQATVTLEMRNTLGKNTNNPRWYTHISQLTQFMPPPETYKSEIGSQSTMWQVHTGAYAPLLPTKQPTIIPFTTYYYR